MAEFLNRRKRHPMAFDSLEPLESRKLLTAVLSGNVLVVDGTSGDDVITVSFINNFIVVRNPTELFDEQFLETNVDSITVDAGAGNDRVIVDNDVRQDVAINGGDGNDSLRGGGGDDTIFGEAGNDSISGADGADEINGGAGTDTADYSNRTEALSITLDGVANDGFLGTPDEGEPNEGDDVHSSIDVVLGGSGADLISAAGLTSGRNLYGNSGNDTLIGGLGNDRLNGGNNDDRLDGSAGDDVLVGGEGDQIYIGGAGNDTVTYYFTNRDLRLSLDGVPNDGVRDEDSNIRADVETVIGGGGDDVISGDNGRNHFFGGKGDDSLFGHSANDFLYGETGNDFLVGNEGSDYLYGGDGADTLTGSAGSDRLYGENGNDLFNANDGKNDTLVGGLGTDAADSDVLDSLSQIP